MNFFIDLQNCKGIKFTAFASKIIKSNSYVIILEVSGSSYKRLSRLNLTLLNPNPHYPHIILKKLGVN